MESLNRGMVAVRSTSTQAYIGWRLLGDDPAGTAFNLYRSANGGAAVKLNASPLTATTDYTDGTANLTQSNAYFVRPVIGGVEQPSGEVCALPANTPVQQYLTVPLQLPPGGSTASGAFTYTANDTSVGDLDGDKDYEMVVKWDPTNSKDNSQSGYTGDTLLDAYQLDGSLLWRINFGPNIRSGAHYMDVMVYDFDGDGRAEIMCRTAPGTKDGTGAYVGGLAKWQGGSRPAFSNADDYRNASGYILSGPEFLTVFDGLTGAELATVRFFPQRDPDNLIDNPTSARLTTLWGDGYGNRFDRFLAAVAYVDGQRPSGIFCRGYYTRTFVTAYDWRGGLLTKRWSFDSATNPTYAGQGAHSISVGDLDGDGKDEIAYGACAIDDNGTGLWNTKLGHGDATHLSEMDPDSPGLKFFMPHESPSSYGIYGTSLTEQRDGQVLWGVPGGGDVGRGVAFDIDPRFPGFEAWATNSSLVYTVKGAPIPNTSRPSLNFAVWWDADPLRELLDGTKVDKWNWTTGSADRQLTMSGVSSNNGTKATPNLSADILGDWREEILMRTSDNTAMRVYTTIKPATSRLYTLMHDPQYRVAIAWQNTGYNQPPHPGFFLGQDMAAPPRAPIWHGDLVWQGAAGSNTWSVGGAARWLRDGVQNAYVDGDSVLLDYTGNTSSVLTLSGTLAPGEVIVHNATGKNYTFAGSGSLGGAMTLTKAGLGSVTIQNTHPFTGATLLQQGDLVLTGALSASQVTVEGLGRASGTGNFGNGLIVKARGRLAPGTTGAGTLSVGNRLDLNSAFLDIDIASTPAVSSDAIAVTGNLNLSGVTRINLNRLGGTISAGSYPLITYSGTLTGTAANLSLSGLGGAPGTISISGGTVMLNVAATRATGALTWRGSGATWNLASAQNWLLGGTADYFVTGDAVLFNDSGTASPTVTLVDELVPASVSVDSTSNYTFAGSGMIGGSGGLTKANTGKLTVQTANTYTGATVISGGVLEVATVASGGAASTLGAASASSSNLVFNGGTLRFTGSLSSTNRGATFASGGGTLEVASGSGSLIVSGPLVGTGALTKTGAGTLNLAGVSTYSGGTTIKAGTVLLGSFEANEDGLGTGLVTLDGGILSMTDLQSNNSCSWPLYVPAGSVGRLNADGRCTLSGALTGGGTFTFSTPFVRTALSGNWSTFNGQINVVTDSDGGDFRINNSAGYANAAINFANLVNAYSLTGFSSIGAVTGGTGAVLSGTAWTIGAKNTDATFDGIITGNSVTKVGSGHWSLTGDSTYTGATTVTAGKLMVIGSLAATPVTVATTGALGGTGSIAGAVTCNGSLAPGVAVGTLTLTNGLTLASTSALNYDLGTTSDRADVTGNLTLDGTVHVTAAAGFAAGTYTLATYSGTLTNNTLNVGTLPSGFSASVSTATAGQVNLVVIDVSAPQITSDPAASANPVIATSTNLSVTATDNGGEGNLTYTWSATGPAAVTYSANGTNAAKITTATFSAAGVYTFTVTATDLDGDSFSRSVNVTVSATPSALTVSPASASVVVGTTATFFAVATDQFGAPTSNPSVTWSTTGGGTISAGGIYTAATIGGPYQVTATSGSISASAQVSVTNASVILGNLTVNYDGAPKPVTVTTLPSGLAVDVTYDGSATPPTDPGTYAVVATVDDANYSGSATGSLVITRAPISITWTGATNYNWDTVTTNWQSAASIAYAAGDTVSFTDSGAAVSAINLVANVQPAAVIVNATKNYTFSGSGVITGTATLTKSGSGTLTLTGVHTLSGATAISGGTLVLSQVGTTGATLGSSGITLSNGGIFRMGTADGRNFPNNAITVPAGAAGTLSSASLANGYGGSLVGAADSVLTLSGPVSMGGSGAPQFGSFAGTVSIPSGSQLRFSSTSGPNGNGGANTTFQIDGTMNTRNSGGGNGVVLGALTGGGSLQGQTNTTVGTVTYYIGAKNLDTTFSGVIANGGQGTTAINKLGTGTLTLSGISTYTSSTTVTAGKLSVTGSLAATTTTVATAGALGGTGTLAGAVTCNGTLAPGVTTGTLNLSNGLVLASTSKLEYDLGTASDRTAVTGNLTLNGTVNVTAAAGLASGTYTLITYTGTLTNNTLDVGTLPAGCTASVDTTTSGQVKLVLTVASTPTTLTVSPVSSTLAVDATAKFSATVVDQLGNALINPSITWSTTGGGTIDADGLFTATTAGGPYQITATSGDLSSSASITVTKATATVTLGDLAATYDGAAKPASASTTPGDLAVDLTYNGSSTAPTAVGTYTVVGTISDANYTGTASGSLVIAPPASRNFSSWVGDQFTPAQIAASESDSTADPDHDSLNNLAEYALGSDPYAFTPQPAVTDSASSLSITFQRPVQTNDVTYRAETSPDFANWTALTLDVLTSGVDPETVRATYTYPTPKPAKTFIRLRFEK